MALQDVDGAVVVCQGQLAAAVADLPVEGLVRECAGRGDRQLFAPPPARFTSIEPFWLSTSTGPSTPSSETDAKEVRTLAPPLRSEARTAPLEFSTVRSAPIRAASTSPKLVLTNPALP